MPVGTPPWPKRTCCLSPAASPVVPAERTLTLALPKTGLEHIEGDLYLADIGIPPQVYERLGLAVRLPFDTRYWMRLHTG